MDKNSTLYKGLENMGILLTEKDFESFDILREELVSWNEKFNLTAITNKDDIEQKHFIDSLYPLKYNLIKENAKICDVGCGAGFPGLPLKIMREDLDITFLDATAKKLTFVSNIIEKLNLTKANILNGRAEEMAGIKSKYRESFDVVVSRAVANLPVLCELCMPFVKKDGIMIALKGAKGEEELKNAKNAIKELGGEVLNKIDTNLPFTDEKRFIIVIKKLSQTNKKYPRNFGNITKKPL